MTAKLLLLALLLPALPLRAQAPTPLPPQDTDHDGLPDALEDALLQRFAPHFMVSATDCSVAPALFAPDSPPTPLADNGTIYAQAFPQSGDPTHVELHFYHLWRRDCGELGHALDTEHVSALIDLGASGDPASSKALFWYAAAHEDTVCDASHLTRAQTLNAQQHGPTVWISAGKHASFLSEALCTHGCGGDRCADLRPLQPPSAQPLINLGELRAPMNDIHWLSSPQWPLSDKMKRSDFTALRLAHLDRLPVTDIAWANPNKRPAQAAILGANSGIHGANTGLGGALTGARATDTALVVANNSTGSALDTAAGKTGNALSLSTRKVWHSLKKSAAKTSAALHPDHTP